MKAVHLNSSQIKEIERKAQQRGTLNSRTIVQRGGGNIIGFAGEEMFASLFQNAVKADTRDYDFVLNGRKIDVKTRGSDKTPRMDWDCKIPAYSVDQQRCDIYVFVITRNDGSSGNVLGWISKADFKAKARHYQADKLFGGYGKHVVDQKYLVVSINELNPIETL